MKISFTRLFISTAFFIVLLFASNTKSFAESSPASCTAAIGSPANGTSHYIAVSWSTVSGSTSYLLESSPDNVTWTLILIAHGVTTSNYDAGNTGNVPVYLRVSAAVSGDTSAATNCTEFPIYTACDVPALPSLSNAQSSSLSLQLEPESPTPNAAGTTYSIYCTTTSQYVQSNGSLGATEIFNTMPTWGTVTVTGLTSSTSYCFFAAARNNDGDIRTGIGSATVTQAFNSNALVENGGPSQWFIPQYGTYMDGGQTYAYGCSEQSNAPGYPHWSWTDTAGCDAPGAIYYQGDDNWGYEGCNLTSPVANLSGKSSIQVSLNLTNGDAYAGDYIDFSFYAGDSYSGGTFVNPSITVNGVPASNPLYFTEARSCATVIMTFDLTGTGTGNTYCSFGVSADANELNYSSAGYYALIDDISIGQTPPPTACLSTALPLGIYESEKASGFSLYPNPANDNLILTSRASIKNARISICNVLGQEVYSEQVVSNVTNGFSVQVPLSVTAGIYFVQVIDETGKWMGKFVKE